MKPGSLAEPVPWPAPGTELPGLTEPKAALGHPGLAAGGWALAVGAEQEEGWSGRLALWLRLSDIQSC